MRGKVRIEAIILGALIIGGVLQAPAWPQTGTTFTVTRFDDPVPDACAPGDCSLREAVIAADGALGAPTISVPPGVYTLTIASGAEANPAVGDLDVSGEMIIQGAGADATILDANGDVTGQRAFEIADTGSLTIRGMTITGGRTTDLSGGIRLFSGSLTMENAVVTENEAVGNNSGGIHANIGTSVTLSDVTVSNNTAGNIGGGLILSGDATLTNVTISGNAAESFAGGILINGNSATLVNVTITDNTGESDNSGGGSGGGLSQSAATVILRNSIVTGNRVGSTGSAPDCDGTITSEGGNIIQDTSGCTFTPAAGDVTGQAGGLGPLADNGGPTTTHALLPGSPAIDRGGAGCPGADQRGAPRTGPCDSGAYEVVLCQTVLVNEVGTEGADVLTGTEVADGVLALGGNDKVSTIGGNDAVCAGPGNDTANGGGGKDRLAGESGKDKLRGQGGNDRLKGGPGKDLCVGGGGKDRAACETEKSV